jgi:hypothetical protein
VPLALVVMFLVGLDELFKTALKASKEERILALFLFLFVSLLVLTAIGIFFRGPGMSLVWPWEMAAAH